jgi:hypothetical protein
MITGIGPENNFLCFSTAFKRRRWEVEWDTSTALELLYIGTRRGFQAFVSQGPAVTLDVAGTSKV